MDAAGIPSIHKRTITKLPRSGIRFMFRRAGPLTGRTETGHATAARLDFAFAPIAWLAVYPLRKRQVAIKTKAMRPRHLYVFITGYSGLNFHHRSSLTGLCKIVTSRLRKNCEPPSPSSERMLASYSNETDLSSSLVAPSPANSHLKTSTDFPASGSTQRTCKASGKSSLTNQTFKPRKVLLKELNCRRVLVQARDCMSTDSSTAKRIIAASRTTDGNGPNRTSAKRDTSNGSPADCDQDGDCNSAERHEANGKTPERENAAC